MCPGFDFPRGLYHTGFRRVISNFCGIVTEPAKMHSPPLRDYVPHLLTGAAPRGLFVVRYEQWSAEDRRRIRDRARALVGAASQPTYRILTSNCEHFTWSVKGGDARWVSPQVCYHSTQRFLQQGVSCGLLMRGANPTGSSRLILSHIHTQVSCYGWKALRTMPSCHPVPKLSASPPPDALLAPTRRSSSPPALRSPTTAGTLFASASNCSPSLASSQSHCRLPHPTYQPAARHPRKPLKPPLPPCARPRPLI